MYKAIKVKSTKIFIKKNQNTLNVNIKNERII